MPTIRFLVRTIDAIKPPKEGRREYWDKTTGGFGLRVSETGRKTWTVLYRHEGRLRRLTVGTYPKIPLARARKLAEAALHEASLGRDPAGEKQQQRKAETFADLAEIYMRLYAVPEKRSWRKDRQALDRDLLPRFGHRKADKVARRDVIALLDEIKERGAGILANRTLEIMRRIYNWGISRDIVSTNPCTRIEKPSPERRRERVLTDDEIRAVWRASDGETPLMAGIFKLRLLTAQRGGEISYMRQEDIDEASGWWTIPPEYSKNGLAHRVPLNDPALDLLRELKPLSESSEWVFPSPSGKGPLRSFWKAAADVRKRSGVDFRLHDLRRTVASKMTGDLGISRLTVSKLLNHVETGITATYDRASYDREKRAALTAWGQRLDWIVSGKAPVERKVVELRTA